MRSERERRCRPIFEEGMMNEETPRYRWWVLCLVVLANFLPTGMAWFYIVIMVTNCEMKPAMMNIQTSLPSRPVSCRRRAPIPAAGSSIAKL